MVIIKNRNLTIAILLLISFIYIIFYLWLQFHSGDELFLINIIASIILGSYAYFILYDQYGKKELFSPISIYAILMLFHFSLPGLVLPFYRNFFSDSFNLMYAGEAQSFVLIAFIFFHIGYLIGTKWTLSLRKNFIKTKRIVTWKDFRVIFVTVILLIAGWCTRYYIIENFAYSQFARQILLGRLNAIFRVMELFPLYALIIVCIHYWMNEKSPNKLLIALIILFISEVFYWFPAGRKTEIILTIILPIIIKYLIKSTLPPKKVLITLGILIIMLFPVIHYYRTAMDIGGYTKIANIDDITESIALAPNLSINYKKNPFEVILERISLIEPICGSMRIIKTNTWPLFLGKTYLWAVPGLVPGIFWKNKPDYNLGTKFGHASGILDYSNKITAISVTYIGEAFLNFAWFGVIVLFFFGIAFSIFYRWAAYKGDDSTSLLLYILVVPFFLYIGGTFALYFCGLIKLLVIFYILSQFMTKRESHRLFNQMFSPF